MYVSYTYGVATNRSRQTRITVQSPYKPGGDMARTAKIELRAEPEPEERIREAARLANQSVSRFVLDAASERAEEVLRAATTTTVPADYFDELYRALDEPPAPNPALHRATRKARRLVQA